ncbi:YbaB/EbfC family DNA-binding protein [Actinoplanes teichomyceticus]|uniref:YbaB/EbfC DNA-binding family protein n=1 Tax=Actinoplanes teichomyceticus TaxID=1867 RepID=A0A561VKV1_ACTTI|nr:YbaB/EbfC family DNA-binding protein [Actinoplanes teichomyceticus]TWG12255.1 hypothetical protein FHX34_105122 [Actinoplanes teichomyceticus]GIF14192.1 hypothetical protein Ate01nite_42240 [Actinoplanes teichomyceticus]
MADFGNTQIDQLLAQMRQTLDGLRAGPTTSPVTESPETVGEAAAGQVRAVMRDGRLDSLRLDPRMLRLPGEDLSAHIVVAVNAALAATRQQGSPNNPTTVDPDTLARQLREVQDASLRQMTAFGTAMNEALAQIRQAGEKR